MGGLVEGEPPINPGTSGTATKGAALFSSNQQPLAQLCIDVSPLSVVIDPVYLHRMDRPIQDVNISLSKSF